MQQCTMAGFWVLVEDVSALDVNREEIAAQDTQQSSMWTRIIVGLCEELVLQVHTREQVLC